MTIDKAIIDTRGKLKVIINAQLINIFICFRLSCIGRYFLMKSEFVLVELALLYHIIHFTNTQNGISLSPMLLTSHANKAIHSPYFKKFSLTVNPTSSSDTERKVRFGLGLGVRYPSSLYTLKFSAEINEQ